MNLDLLIKQKTPLTICYIDVDNLKKVNDQFGHKEGDKYIQTIYSCIIKNCRIGGDEFIVIFPHCRRNSAFEVMERVQTTILKYEKSNNSEYKHSFSSGYSENSKDNSFSSVNQMIKAADEEMYSEKRMKKV